jgi:sugar lactone lactonase YvrE
MAGWPPFGFQDGTGTAAIFSHPGGIAIASSGNVYVADSSNCVIRKITPAGVVTTLAGMPGMNGYADGTGSAARFQYPGGICVDANEVLYVADGSQTIRRVTSTGVVTTIAGRAWVNGSADGPALSASFWNMGGLTLDASGTLYIVDGTNLTIRKLQGGTVSTIAGSPGQWGGTDGNGSAARFYFPNSIAVDASGNLFVTDAYGQTVRKITPAGDVSTFAGLFNNAGTADGSGSAARFHYPEGLCIDSSGNLYLTDTGSDTIRRISPTAAVTTVAGSPNLEGSADGTGAAARFSGPGALAIDSSGVLYVADSANATIRRISSSATVTTLAGTSAPQGLWADGPARSARFFCPWGVVLDASGNAYLTDQLNHVIRKVSASGTVTTVAGTPGIEGSQDGPAASATFSQPEGLALASNGDLYVADSGNHVIRRISASGTVTTVAGLAGSTGSTDGAGAAARFNAPAGLAFDASGRLFVADSLNATIRIVDSSFSVSTFTGQPGTAGFRDGPSTAALLSMPQGIAFDREGNLLVADGGNSAIRRVSSSGWVTTLAGGGSGQLDGLGTQARFYFPQGVAVDAEGFVYVGDTYDDLVRRISPQGRVTTIGGQEQVNSLLDSTSANSLFSMPIGLAVDSAGRLWVADSYNNVLRRGSAVSSLRANFDGTPTEFVEGGTLSLPVNAWGGSGSLTFQWFLDGALVDGATGDTLHLATARAGHFSTKVSDGTGVSVTADTWITLTQMPLSLVSVPADRSVQSGSAAGFSVSALGSGVLSYQWSKDGRVLADGSGLAGCTTATLTLAAAATADAGVYSVLVSDSYGHQLTAQARLTVASSAPVITQQPLAQSVAVDAAVSFTVVASGDAPLAYQWTINGTDLAGATSATLSLPKAQVLSSGAYRVRISNSGGSTLSEAAFLTVTASSGGPQIQSQPQSYIVASGGSVVITVNDQGSVSVTNRPLGILASPGASSYQWFLDGNALSDGEGLSGARSATLLLRGSAAKSGAYTCLVSNSAGSLLSKPAAITVTKAVEPGRLMNLSTRAFVGSGANQLITGFACSNESSTAPQPVLIRAIGPTLAAFGLDNWLKVPALEVESAGRTLASNTGWMGAASLIAASQKVGAFTLPDTKSADSALLLADMPSESSSALVSGSDSGTGLALVEIYDATAAASTQGGTRRLMNLSARGFVGTGSQNLIAGLVIGGGTAKTILLRASGPALGAFGLGGLLADPKIELYGNGNVLAANSGWKADSLIATVAASVGAFSWGSSATPDAALLLTLQPGTYTLVVSGASGDTGLALVEVYDVP